MSKILSVNAGSSSLKFKLFDMPSEQVICSGMADRIGHDDGLFKIEFGGKKLKENHPLPNHAVGVELLLKALVDNQIITSFDEISGIGHRVVQGGKFYATSTIFDETCAQHIEALIPLAPLHNKPNLVGYRAFKEILPKVGHVAVFDTAFHQTMEPQDFLFPIPYEYYEKYDIRRYGFHGTSHQYLSEEGQKMLGNPAHSSIISCHIGSGASITAIKDGKCVATSMGLTPLGGLMMGTRTGDIDPSVLHFSALRAGKTHEEMYEIFNKKSGMLGVSGISNDTREIEEAVYKGNSRAILASKLFVRRIADFIGQYFVRLGGADLIIFSAGVGENAGFYRAMILDEIKEALNISYDAAYNLPLRGVRAMISTPASAIKVAIIPTDEEVMIARDTYHILNAI
ncbi:MAG TPA: acetate kinase [Firmicutes bacterium]|jgi:acetate kinase|nr:acetate kinase [Bacillota bacterium]